MATLPTELSFADIVADTTRWEGRISHMYLDTVAKVTVGVGKMLPDANAALALGFVRRDSGAKATPAEIKADFAAVAAQPKGLLAGSYKKFTQLDLPDAAIDALLKSVVDGFMTGLAQRYVGWSTMPALAKQALLDMTFNLGPGGLAAFGRLKLAVDARNWDNAAKECARNGIAQVRNDWTRDLFLKCKG